MWCGVRVCASTGTAIVHTQVVFHGKYVQLHSQERHFIKRTSVTTMHLQTRVVCVLCCAML